ncbi:hypothetical protein ASD72_18685 [Pseudoxanthomonas sp. Root630]|nr:hypothetical protein ASD72_18685 [Pseudoxanthomonas sp. Root630]
MDRAAAAARLTLGTSRDDAGQYIASLQQLFAFGIGLVIEQAPERAAAAVTFAGIGAGLYYYLVWTDPLSRSDHHFGHAGRRWMTVIDGAVGLTLPIKSVAIAGQDGGKAMQPLTREVAIGSTFAVSHDVN